MRMTFKEFLDWGKPYLRWGQAFMCFANPKKNDPDLFYETSERIARVKAQTSYPEEYHKYVVMEEHKDVDNSVMGKK